MYLINVPMRLEYTLKLFQYELHTMLDLVAPQIKE